MAFQQPQQRRQAVRQTSAIRPIASDGLQHEATITGQTAAARGRLEEEAQEWVLFSPTQEDEDEEQQSATSYTSQTPRTANLSRGSDLDSLDTRLRSGRQIATDEHEESLTCQGTEYDDDDEGEDMDSLDDGLHDFQEPLSPRLDQSRGTVLPRHDGLGTFPTTYAHAASQGMQEHLWQFERYNPHRRKPQRRRSSVQKRLDTLDDDDEAHDLDRHEERRLRIEKWRLEQSRAVLEEIERETRRRQRRMSTLSGQSSALSRQDTNTSQSLSTVPVLAESAQAVRTAPDDHSAATHIEAESFWQRITRRVIKDLMGLDENTLSVIFGEELATDLDSTPTQPSPLTRLESTSTTALHTDMAWEQRLLERIARELGLLADRLSEHDGAFATYTAASPSLHLHNAESATPFVPTRSRNIIPTPPARESASHDNLFNPTFPATNTLPPVDTSLWGIEEEPLLNGNPATTNTTTAPEESQQDTEYWERDLDVGVIFRYLRNRFSSSSSRAPAPVQEPPRHLPAIAHNGPLPPAWASGPSISAPGTSPESFRRADMIRRNHPLVSHAATVSATRRRESMLLRRQHQFLLHRRAGSSSCASQSTKRTRSGGSRRYWDFPNGGGGGSATGGSAVSVTSGGYEGMMGSWGEV